jgi:hypothetical protein
MTVALPGIPWPSLFLSALSFSHQREPLRRCWIDHPYGEEEITRLEDELLPAMESFLARIDAIDQQLREAQKEQEAHSSWSGRP